jgi:hypothetical protein
MLKRMKHAGMWLLSLIASVAAVYYVAVVELRLGFRPLGRRTTSQLVRIAGRHQCRS